jgi:hypothetical protein
MGTPTLIRVKRRITDDPSDILVLSAKRCRTSESPGEGGGSDVRLLKLAGTVQTCEEQGIASIVQKKKLPNFEELKKQYKKSSVKSSTKSRAKAKGVDREAQRLRVVNTKRSIQENDESTDNKDEDNPTSTEQNSIYKLYDIFDEKDKENEKKTAAPERLSCNGVEMIREYRSQPQADSDYVYDVYYAEQDEFGDFNDALLDGLVSVQPFCFGDSEFMYDEYREDPDAFKYDDDEDSNDEGHRDNEYPDEDDFSEDEAVDYGAYSDHLDLGINRLRLTAQEEDLSSEEEDGLVYTKSFQQDEAMHGKSYAKYKADMLKEFQDDGLLDDSSSEDSDG